ncbi:MAG: helix-turn-helix transcriptional regulator [Clostridium sp.]|nr:helix-turn-helix transcriptional regulator [Clostridium sp.]MCM1444368.1 helix-turn-helix transcriptional regulator [Candidatus Amulumruptor caecigallinarius]
MNQEKNGIFISNQRKEKKLTQEQLAEKMGVSKNAVSKWERGLSFPDVSLYKKLCEELDISIEELINGEKDNSDEAKNRALINTIESREKEKKKLFWIIILSIIIIITLIIISVFVYKTSEDKISDYYEKNYQKTFVARNVDALLKYRNDGGYPDYYGGMYISDDANNLILLIVKDKIPSENTREIYYYNELINLDESIKIEYVKNSYNVLEEVNDKIIEYITTHEIPEEYNSNYVDIIKNKVIVNYVTVNDNIIQDFKKNIVDSDLIEFQQNVDIISDSNKCINYPTEIGEKPLETHGELLINIQTGKKKYVPVSLSIYDDGTYELFTAYEACKPGRLCNMMLKYTKSIKGTYNYDIRKILEYSINANNKSYSMENLPEYEIYLGLWTEEYDTLMFTVEKGKKNKYLDEFLKSINVDLNKCAKPEYID